MKEWWKCFQKYLRVFKSFKEQGDKHVDAVSVCLANGTLLYNDLQNLYHARHETTSTLSMLLLKLYNNF